MSIVGAGEGGEAAEVDVLWNIHEASDAFHTRITFVPYIIAQSGRGAEGINYSGGTSGAS